MMFQQFSIHDIYGTMYGKIVRTTFHWIFVLQLRGEYPTKYGNYWTNVLNFLGPSPWVLRRTMQGNIALTIFHSWWHICYIWKSVGTSFQCIIVPQLRGEGPKQEHNFMDPGYQSVTQWEKNPYIIIAKTGDKPSDGIYQSSNDQEFNLYHSIYFWVPWKGPKHCLTGVSTV